MPKEKIQHILLRLNQAVDGLIAQGITDFISGGALGFDQMAASLVVVKKEMGNPVRLMLRCRVRIRISFGQQTRKSYIVSCWRKRMR